MNKRFLNIVLVLAASAGIAVSGCGSGSSGSADTSHTVSGIVSASKPVSGSVMLQDSSTPAATHTTRSDEEGKYSFDVSRLKAPFIVRAEAPASGATGTATMYSFAEGAGRANVNPFSHATVAAAAELSDDGEMHKSGNRMEQIRSKYRSVVEALKAKLAPLFEQYGVAGDPVRDDYESDRDADSDNGRERLDALFSDVRISIDKGNIVVTNKQTGGVIFRASVSNIDGGTFYPENLPKAPSGTPVDGAALYASSCSSCHGPLASSEVREESAGEIRAAIEAESAMRSLASLSDGQIRAIATALTGSSSPGACTYTYSAWGACRPDGTQTRTMLTSSPAGCTGTPDLSRACTYTPPTQACTYTYSAWGACQPDGTQTRTMLTSSPAGCTGTPYLSRTCTYVPPVTTCNSFTYSAWGACQSNNTQTRSVLTSSPAGCTGGTPVLSQACTYVPPVTTCNSFTYSAWGACQSNNTQTRTVLTSSPAGCTGGTPVLSQACTYTPPAPACGSCHAIPPASGKHSRHTSFASCSTCHGSGYSSTAVNSTTHNNGTRDIVSSLNYNASTRTCGSPGCHGSRTW